MTMLLNMPVLFCYFSPYALILNACSKKADDDRPLISADSDSSANKPGHQVSRAYDNTDEYIRIFAHVIYRHGDRAPLFLYPKDPNGEENWPNGLHHLTEKGLKQLFRLGKYIRKLYGTFLSDHYIKKEIYVRSTDEQRTKESAQANLAGLYSPKDDEEWDPKLIPADVEIVTVPAEDDYSLIVKHPCPRYNAIVEQHCISHISVYNEKYRDFFEHVSKISGIEELDYTSLLKIYDPLLCEFENNLNVSHWTDEESKFQLKTGKAAGTRLTALELIFYLMRYAMNLNYNTHAKAKLTAGYLLGEIWERLKKVEVKRKGKEVQGLEADKFIMYSGKDNIIMALMYALDVTGIDRPFMVPYASALFIDVYEKGGELFVEVSFKSKSPNVDCRGDGCKHAEHAQHGYGADLLRYALS